MDTSHPALILGLSKTAIGVARCLGRSGIRVRAIDDRPGIARISGFVDGALCPNPITERRRFVDYLSELADADSKPHVIYITDDRYVEALADKPAVIDRFLTDLPPESVSRTILDKAKQLEAAEALGIPTPTTVVITAEHDIDEASARIGLPMLLKGGKSNQWKSIFRGAAQKGFVVSTNDELADHARRCIRLGATALAQRIVPGPETNLVGLVAYISSEGEPLGWLTRRKLRQHPPFFGSGSLVETTTDGETAELSLRLLTGLGYRGTASVEFKRDESDGGLRLIEVNPRYPLINALGPASGVDLPLVQYLHLTGQSVPPLRTGRPGVKWIDVGGNLASAPDYRALVTLRDWFKGFRGPRVYAESSWDDPLPLLGEIAAAPGRLLARRRERSAATKKPENDPAACVETVDLGLMTQRTPDHTSSGKHVSIVGAGAMGAALAINLDRSGHAVTLCATEFDAPFVEAIERTGTHPSIAHEVPNSISIESPSHWKKALAESDLVVLAVSSVGLRATFERVKGAIQPGVPVLVATKGWDPDTAEPLSTALSREAEGHTIALLVGPTLASEIASGRPTAVVCASESLVTARSLAHELGSPTLRIFVTDDVVGVEVGAALKNVIAVAIGICDGLAEARTIAFTNAKAALFSQGLIEMTRLARALGGRVETVLGLTGSGDLFVTVMGGRNGQFGRLIGTGIKPDDALAQMATTVEGFEGTARAIQLAERLGLEMPLVRMVHSVLFGGVEPSAALVSFFSTWTDGSETS